MRRFTPISTVEQLAEYIKEDIRTGRLNGIMPGVAKLVNDLGVGTKTVIGAMEQLEREGLLVPRGNRLGRKIVMTEELGISGLRIGILLYDVGDSKSFYNVELLESLQKEGHITKFASKTLMELNMDVARVARFVKASPADAWIIFSGSKEVLEWFAAQDKPAFAWAGRRRSVHIASTGPEKFNTIREATQQLLALGHQRIVMLAREIRRKPKPGQFEQTFLDELTANGIKCGDYNLPSWEQSPKGLIKLLDNLFLHTPPSALIIEEPSTFIAAQNHLAQRGILAPRDVSLICDDPDSVFTWCRPSIAHIDWNASQCVRRIVRWANNVARGKDDRRRSFIKATFVNGGTVGPASKQPITLRVSETSSK